MEYSIARDYSNVTGMRNSNITDFSGEDFYHDKLNYVFASAYKQKDKLVLILDGTIDGYSPSFLDEAIGNLVYDFSLNIVKQFLVVVSDDEIQWKDMIENSTYPNWEERRLKGIEPKITKQHNPWYRLVNGRLVQDEWIKYIGNKK